MFLASERPHLPEAGWRCSASPGVVACWSEELERSSSLPRRVFGGHVFRDKTALPWSVIPYALSAEAWFALLPSSSITAALDFREDEPPCFPP